MLDEEFVALPDHAGLSARAAADQLGHATTSMTTDVYFGRKVLVTGAAAVLEALGTRCDEPQQRRGVSRIADSRPS